MFPAPHVSAFQAPGSTADGLRIASAPYSGMRRLVFLAFAFSLTSGCGDDSAPPECLSPDDCPAGGRCVDGFCVAADASVLDTGAGSDMGDDACTDFDSDGVCDDVDICANGDDADDADGDGVPDACDVCDGEDDNVDTDDDGTPDECDCEHTTACSADAMCTESGDAVSCRCNLGYEGDGATCSPIDCGPLGAPDDGSVDASETTLGGVATYSCDEGFVVAGEPTRTCQPDGTWSGDEPTCSTVDCGSLGAPTDGTVDVPATGLGSEATYGCEDGYLLTGDATRTCQADETWSGAEPTCVLVDCGALRDPTEGGVSTDRNTLGGTATYLCNSGYSLSGPATRMCGTDAVWTGSAPTCGPVDCGTLPDPTNGSVSAATTTFGSIATYFCDGGFMMIGSNMRTCQADVTWSGGAPTCVPEIVDCGTPRAPLNGSVSAPDTTVGQRATYSCDSGYRLMTGQYAVCRGDRTWIGSAPACELLLSCACAGAYSANERVRATQDIRLGLPTGAEGTTISAASGPLVEWDGFTDGHNGNCGATRCGTCTSSPINNRWYVGCATVETQRLTCACDGNWTPGDRVVALVDSPSRASNVLQGRGGTVVAGNTGTVQILVQWDAWTDGHDGRCSAAECGPCTASATDNRWWTACDQIGRP